jgi:hypothetical protein
VDRGNVGVLKKLLDAAAIAAAVLVLAGGRSLADGVPPASATAPSAGSSAAPVVPRSQLAPYVAATMQALALVAERGDVGLVQALQGAQSHVAPWDVADALARARRIWWRPVCSSSAP